LQFSHIPWMRARAFSQSRGGGESRQVSAKSSDWRRLFPGRARAKYLTKHD
jgi:hypothetical protein